MSVCTITESAIADLVQIHDYIAEQNVDVARRVVLTIRERCVALADTPMIGRARPNLGTSFRSFPVRGTPYLIIYRPVTNGVEILHIHHGRRNLA